MPITMPVTDSAIDAFPKERADCGSPAALLCATTTHICTDALCNIFSERYALNAPYARSGGSRILTLGWIVSHPLPPRPPSFPHPFRSKTRPIHICHSPFISHCRMLPVIPYCSGRAKGVPFVTGVFLRFLMWELGPKNFPNFRLWEMPAYKHSQQKINILPLNWRIVIVTWPIFLNLGTPSTTSSTRNARIIVLPSHSCGVLYNINKTVAHLNADVCWRSELTAPSQPYDWRNRWDLVSLRDVKSEEQGRVSAADCNGRYSHRKGM